MEPRRGSRGGRPRGRGHKNINPRQVAAIGSKKSCPSKHRGVAERRADAEARQTTLNAELAALTHQRQERLARIVQQSQARQFATSKTPEQVAREFALFGDGAYRRGQLLMPPWTVQEELVAELIERENVGIDSVLSAYMGIGKTLVGLLLIYLTTIRRLPQRFGHPTLIVGPKGVYHQWMKEASKFFPPELMTFDSIESSDDALTRFDAQRALACLDFVVISYDTLKASTGSALFTVPWHRIIVDEGTFIINEATQVFAACAQITAKRRLFISGTPVPNARASEMNALLRFLGAEMRVPSLASLARASLGPQTSDWLLGVDDEDDEDDDADDAAVDADTASSPDDIVAQWRRALDTYWVSAQATDPTILPTTVQKLQTHETETVWVTLSDAEQRDYEACLREANAPEERKNRLRWITRLRQLCNSSTLTTRTEVKKRVAAARREIRDAERKAIKGDDKEAAATAVAAQRLRRARKKAGLSEWGHVDPVAAATGPGPPLPSDDDDSEDDDEEAAENDEETTTAAAELPPPILSSKYQAVLNCERTRMKPGEKALIISETLGPLEELQHIARAHGISCEMLSGEMTTRQRNLVTERVGDPSSPDPRFVMLPIRLGFGINGLQGTEAAGGGANYVFFLDGYWNEALELQGLARLLRPGQLRDVFSIKFVTLGTVEELVLRHNQFKKMLHRLILDANAHRKEPPTGI